MTARAMRSAAAEAPEVGCVLARKYRVEHVLGAGGMAVVVAATHLQLQELVAIKLLRREIAARPGAIDRFVREARVAMKLRGEHAVRIHDVGMLDDGNPYIVMEHLDGEDLGTVLKKRGRIEPRLAADYVVQACEALSEAHPLGVVHRDLKPSNLFLARRVDGSMCIKVLDFGVSKIVGDEDTVDAMGETAPPSSEMEIAPSSADTLTAPPLSDSFTRTNALVGSPRYMAPEQIRSSRDVDARADVWALGVVLYELLCGVPPFMGDGIDEVRDAILEHRHAPLAAHVEVPSILQAVVDTCLAKDPSDRFQDVESLARALAPFAATGANASIVRIAKIIAGRRAALPPLRTYASLQPCVPTLRSEIVIAGDLAPAPAPPTMPPPAIVGRRAPADFRLYLAWTVAVVAVIVAAAAITMRI